MNRAQHSEKKLWESEANSIRKSMKLNSRLEIANQHLVKVKLLWAPIMTFMASILANCFSWFGFKWNWNAHWYKLLEFRLHRFRWFLSLLQYSDKNLTLRRFHKRLMGGKMSLNIESFVAQSNWLKERDEDDDSLDSSLLAFD